MVLLIKRGNSLDELAKETTNKLERLKMIQIKSILRFLPVLLGALYLIADANEMDYDYAWDHSVYPPFTGNNHMHFKYNFIL